jgi:hypothetical protein
MAAIHLYCDESGKFQINDYTSFCGYIQSVDTWQKFSDDWNDIRRHYGVPPIHMSGIMHPEDNKEWLEVKNGCGTGWESRGTKCWAALS